MNWVGILILFFPFLYAFFYKDKNKAFLYILSIFFVLHLLIALITQYFGIFTYINIIFIYSIILFISIITVLLSKRKIINFKIQPLVLIVFGLIFVQLWSVHYRYTGPVQTVLGTFQVQNDSYSYPKFSDEWVAGSLAKYSLETGKLPLVNPFAENTFFLNLLFPFHVTVASFFMISNLDPILNFAILPIFLGLTICITVFILLRQMKVSLWASLVTISFLPLISQAGNAPGLWFALPYTVGLLFLLIFIYGIYIKDSFLYITSLILSFVFYPPIIVFLLPVVFFGMFKKKPKLTIVFLSSIILLVIFPDIYSRIIRENLDGGMISFSFTAVLPILLIPFSVLGMFILYRNKNYLILIPIAVGLIYWVFYMFYPQVLIIEYPRVIIITSILLILASGFGFDIFESIFSKRVFQIFFIILLVLITYVYPFSNNWKTFVLKPFDKNYTARIMPTAPITRYLTVDDINLFKNFNNKIFIAPPWKGLVIASVTDNIPLETKPSTITTNILSYSDFMKSSCLDKQGYIQEYQIEYIYSANINCPNIFMTKIGESKEKLILYKIN